MKIVAFVPVKLNNERLPGKNLKPFFDGTPLLHFILKSLLKVTEIEKVYVFCSEERIREYLPEKICFLKRPAELDAAEAAPQDIMREFIARVDADIYVTSHATAPFVSEEHIRECVVKVQSGDFDSAFTAEKMQRLLWKDEKPMNFKADHIPRTQDLEIIYSEVSAVYVYKKDVFLSSNRRIGDHPYICEVSGAECIDIDDPEDFLIADAVYEKIICRCQGKDSREEGNVCVM